MTLLPPSPFAKREKETYYRGSGKMKVLPPTFYLPSSNELLRKPASLTHFLQDDKSFNHGVIYIEPWLNNYLTRVELVFNHG